MDVCGCMYIKAYGVWRQDCIFFSQIYLFLFSTAEQAARQAGATLWV